MHSEVDQDAPLRRRVCRAGRAAHWARIGKNVQKPLLGLFSKKRPNRGRKSHSTLKGLKNPKGGPFYVKKIFISDSALILCGKSSCNKDFNF